MPPSAPITYVCTACGSDQVKLDSWAAWAVETQSWELDATMQMAFCPHCDCETSIVAKPLPYLQPAAGPQCPTPASIPSTRVEYEILVNGSDLYHRSEDPDAALQQHHAAEEEHMDDNPPACVTIRRRTGDTVEQMTYAELLDAAKHYIRTR